MAKEGWISPWAFQDGALSSDDLGRSAMADGYIVDRMLSQEILAKLKMIATLEKRLKALEKPAKSSKAAKGGK